LTFCAGYGVKVTGNDTKVINGEIGDRNVEMNSMDKTSSMNVQIIHLQNNTVAVKIIRYSYFTGNSSITKGLLGVTFTSP
jgi:hypothetical protein